MIVNEQPLFSARETHGRSQRQSNFLIAASDRLCWRSMHASLMIERPLETTERALEHPSLIYHVAHPTRVTRRLEGGTRECQIIMPRQITITPGNVAAYWHHAGEPEMLQVYLHRAVYESVAAELCSGDPPRRTITPRFAIHDPMLEQLMLAVATALREPTPPATLYIDTLAQMMAAHLASASTSRSESAAPSKPAPHLQRLADYIEAHLGEDLSLDRLGAEAVLSPLYLIRAFKAAFGESPHQYVMARRIERAKTLLRATDTPAADIALSCGFSSQSHLCSRFQQAVGTTPAAYRRVHSTVRVSMPSKAPTKM